MRIILRFLLKKLESNRRKKVGKSFDTRHPLALISKENIWKDWYICNIEKYENMNKILVEVMPSLNQNKPDSKSSKCGIAACSSRRKKYQYKTNILYERFLQKISTIDLKDVLMARIDLKLISVKDS